MTITALPVTPALPDVAAVEDLSVLSNAKVAEAITTWAGRVAAGEARLLAYIGEFDRRLAWAEPGMLSCAHWMSWRLGMGLRAAYEKVRVARALRDLPVTAAAFAAGQLSWTQVRAITRVACADDEAKYLHVARHSSGSQLERLVRGVRRARRAAEDAQDPEMAAWRMRTRVSYDEDGTMVITARLPAEHGAVVLAALEQARADIDEQVRTAAAETGADSSAAGTGAACAQQCSAEQSPAEDEPQTPPRASLADALVRLARDFLDRRAQDRPDAARRSRARLTVHLDPLSGWARLPDGELLPPTITWTVHDLGRRSREPDLALRELLGAIDGERCRFPGCTRRRKLHAHHVVHWSAGGATDLSNLILLCSRHHTLVHADGFRLTLQPDRTLRAATAACTAIAHHRQPPWRPAGELDPDHVVDAGTLPPYATQPRIDLDYAVWALLQQAG